MRVLLHNQEVLIDNDWEESSFGAPLGFKEDFLNFVPTYAHVMPNGEIMRYGKSIGWLKDLPVINEHEELTR